MKVIERKQYLQRLIDLQGTPDIKIITGIRRSGKSKLMDSYMKYLEKNDASANIIFIDFFDIKFEELKDYHKLNEYIESKHQKGANNYLFIDEVQLCEKFEIAINSLYTSEKYDIYITGSNAFLLSNDLATLFTGRYIEIHVFPFSFAEYCLYHSDRSDIDELFKEYTIKGGFAGSYVYKNEHDRVRYISEVYNTIVNRDLVTKYNLPDTYVLDHLAEYLMDNISNLTSPNKVSDTLTSNQITTNHVTIGKYVKYLFCLYYKKNINIFDIIKKEGF